MAIFKITIISFIVMFTAHVYSQQTCSELAEDNDRLSCYDTSAQENLISDSAEPTQLTNLGINDISNYFNERQIFKLTAHKANYFLPVSYNSKMNDVVYQETGSDVEVDNVEVKFQFSGRLKLLNDMFNDNWDLWFAYTQTSWWQLYNSEESAPFRETDYSPEIFTTYYSDFDVLGLTLLQTDFGFLHQSNGRSEPLSRSWNRIYADFAFARGNYFLSIKPWYRIPESESQDDNPNIEDYVGYGDYRLTYKDGANLYSILFRNNFKFDGDNKSSVELNWAFPVDDIVNLYLQYYNGYGESLIDYDHRVNRISFGILIYDWF